MNPLSVLMWKHLTVRKRRFIHTPIELLLPLLYFGLLFGFRGLLLEGTPKFTAGDLQQNNTRRNVYNTEPVPMDYIVGPSLILYYPSNQLIDNLMDEVGKSLGLKRLDYLRESSYVSGGYFGLPSNESQMLSILKHLTDEEALVIFQDFQTNEDSFPQRLNYTIRMGEDYMTHLYEPLDERVGPHERFGAMYERFMKLQWAVDFSYLKLVSGKPINQKVWLQQFPYAESPTNNTILIVCSLLQGLCYMSIVMPFVFLMSRLMEERTSGVQELIKMVGVSQATLNTSHFLNAVPTGLFYSVGGAILLSVSSTPLIPHTSGLFIFAALALHYVTVVALAFVCSHISQSTQYVTSLSVLSVVVSYIPLRVVQSYNVPRVVTLLSGLLPHAPLYWFWTEVGAVEQYGTGVTLSSMMSSHSYLSGSIIQAYALMVAQAAGLFALTWYLGLVRPGRYGVARPWDFLWSKKRSGQHRVATCDESEEEPMARDPRYFEPTPHNAHVGIEIGNVSKVFDKQRALSNVSFSVLKGEITVLLGHNGAGKTTLMSIITGMFSATEGRVLVNGLDSATHPVAVRRQLGLCPQHNLFFCDLTVLEHVMFFSMLKGQSYKQAQSSSHELLQKLGIDVKANARPQELSGGMKRRLQLACALAGGANVLVLDEPTSGLDVETRRELWDLLLSLRGSRTVLLTTHFMEEADALGDRVAALHAGRLRCHATPMFLKKSIGTGYRLSLTTVGLPHESSVTDVVKSHVGDATLKEKGLNTLSYNLPAQSCPKFAALFADLESKRPELGVDSIGVGVSTLEEVFLKLCSNVDTTFSQDMIDGAPPEPTYNRASGFQLCFNQWLVLMKRHLKYLWVKKLHFLIMQVVIPITLLFVFTSFCNNGDVGQTRKPNSELALNLDLYDRMPDRRAMYSVQDDSLKRVSNKFPKVKFEEAPDVASAVLRSGMDDLSEYHKYLVGVELNDTDAKVLYTTTVRHAAPVALNLLSNTLATRRLPWADGRTITTNNHPIAGPLVAIRHQPVHETKGLVLCGTWAVIVVFTILNTAMSAISLPCSERQSGARHLHIMAGCSPLVHWGSTLTVYTLLYTLILVVPTIIAAKVMDDDSTISRGDFLGVTTVILLLGVTSFLSLAFLLSLYLRERSAGLVLLIVIMVLGVLPAIGRTSAEMFQQPLGWYQHVLSLFRYTVPPYTLTSALYRATYVARLDAHCQLNRDKCPLFIPEMGFDLNKCCVTNEPQSCYFCFEQFSPGKDMLIMLLQSIFYMCLVTLAQHGVFSTILARMLAARYRPPPPRYNDEMVRAEKTYVSKANTLPVKQIPDAMLVDDVHKVYRHWFSTVRAVKGISFSVKKGECFGVLGVNGAGKSTTFKMITGEESPTRGSLFANQHRLKWPREQYLKSLGYCPQFFGLDSFLTGRDNLTTLLTLRGLRAADAAAEVKAWITVVGLEKYTDIRVRGYSGGCTRRLAAALALSSGAYTTLLDEPTAGVDVGARRNVWAAITRALGKGRAVIITSHSMDEMEALCARIGIVSRGELAALGAPAALRAQHAQGHALRLKLRASHDVTDSSAPSVSVQTLKAQLHQQFNCTLKDEHKTMLHYHINETLRYSELFALLEQLRSTFPNLVEDYSVTETTLEEVFLSFAHDTTDESTHTV